MAGYWAGSAFNLFRRRMRINAVGVASIVPAPPFYLLFPIDLFLLRRHRPPHLHALSPMSLSSFHPYIAYT
uniref:Uncharacterized protein n=1 Tax=Heterorhabditis bacteriophora TaxID=37862 RepID=A0A1I7XIA6_HETBA